MNIATKIRAASPVDERAAEYEAACAIVTARYGARPIAPKLFDVSARDIANFNAYLDATDAGRAWDRRVRDVLAGGLGK